MIDRATIAAALATVEELSVSETVPDSIVAFAAWPHWAGARPVETMACLEFQPRWAAYVALPEGSRPDLIDTADPMVETVGQALYGAGLPVELIEPVRLQIAPGATDTVPALRFTITD